MKKILSLVLALALCLSLLPAGALAAESEDNAFQEDAGPYTAEAPAEEAEEAAPVEVLTEGETMTYIPDADALRSSSELFAGYAWRVLYGESGISTLGVYGGNTLSGYNKEIYDQLKSAICNVAANGGSTVFEIAFETLPTCTIAPGEDIKELLLPGLDDDAIFACLLADCPYELYWFDKLEGMSMSLSYVQNPSTNLAILDELTFTFSVALSYQDENTEAEGGPETWVDSGKATAAATAAATARQIVSDNVGKTDYAKLVAYKDYICNAVSYNDEVAGDDYDGGYGDPWQLIYVFDGDEDTNVVCEGYSKAFQYLCDLSGLTCYTVTGTMSGGTGAGAHMWNIVTLDGKNYLVDVTNSDAGTVGQDGSLFLAGTSQNVDGSYTFGSVTFTYDEDTTALYGSSILTLATSDYTDSTEPDPTPNAVASVTIDGKTTDYETIDAAWAEAKGHTATVKLLSSAEITTSLTVGSGDNITLTMADGVELSGSVSGTNGIVSVTGGTFTLEGGSIRNTGDSYSYGVYITGGTFVMQGGKVYGVAGVSVWGGGNVYISAGELEGSDYALGIVAFGTFKVSLSGGTFKGQLPFSLSASVTLASLLADGYAYYDSDDKWIPETSSWMNITGTVTVKKASIQSVSVTPENPTVTYGYMAGEAPTLTAIAILADGITDSVTYQWSQDGAKIEDATSNTYTVPTGLDAGTYTYTCTATAANGYSKSSSVRVTVAQKELELSISYANGGSVTKPYDGTTAAPDGLSLTIENALAGDDVSAAADSYTYNSENVSEANTITANGITLSGDDAGNYKLPEGPVTISGTIVKSTPVIQFQDGPMTATYSGPPFAVPTEDELTITGAAYANVEFSWTDADGNPLASAPINAGTYTLTATIKETDNTEQATAGKTVTITPKTVTATVELEKDSYEYTGKEIKPNVTVKDGETVIDPSEYTVSYSNNTNVGTEAAVIIKNKDGGNYEVNDRTVYFSITALSLETADVALTLPEGGYTYDGNAKEPGVTVVKNGVTVAPSEYTVTYSNTNGGEGDHTNAGTVTVTVTAKDGGNYDGSNSTATFTINPADISGAAVTLTNSLTYNGQEQTQSVTVTLGGKTLALGTDYTVSGNTGTNAGDSTLTVTGTGNYTGTVEAEWTISRKALTIDSVSATNRAYEKDNLDVAVVVTFGGVVENETPAYTATGKLDDANAGNNKTVTVTVTLTDSNYILAANSIEATVNITKAKAPVVGALEREHVRTVSATETITGLGELLPEDRGTTNYTVTVSGENDAVSEAKMDGDTLTYTTKTSASEVMDIITVTAEMQNYENAAINVQVRLVDQTPVTITGVTVADKVYDGEAAVYTGTPVAEANGKTVEIAGYTYTWQTADGEAPVDAGSYQLVVQAVDSHYTGSVTLDFTISKATVTITAEDKSMFVRAALPALTYQVEGLVGEDELVTEPTLTTEADTSKAGTYAIVASDADVGPNYEIAYVNGVLTVRNRPAAAKPTEEPEEVEPCDGGRNCPSYGFSDLSASKWYHEAVDFVLENGLMSGFTDGTFQPNGALTRAMLAQILYNKEGRPAVRDSSTFLDVADTDWYAPAVTWAAKNGLVTGYTSGKFGPEDPVTREQLAAILYRYAVYQGMTAVTLEENLLGFTDASQISSFAVQPMNWAVGRGILTGKGSGILDPKGNATRAEVAQMLMNYMKEIEG